MNSVIKSIIFAQTPNRWWLAVRKLSAYQKRAIFFTNNRNIFLSSSFSSSTIPCSTLLLLNFIFPPSLQFLLLLLLLLFLLLHYHHHHHNNNIYSKMADVFLGKRFPSGCKSEIDLQFTLTFLGARNKYKLVDFDSIFASFCCSRKVGAFMRKFEVRTTLKEW